MSEENKKLEKLVGKYWNLAKVINKINIYLFWIVWYNKGRSRNGGFKMDIIQNPHDTLCKRTLGDKEVAKDFLINYLPDNIVR